jgi:2-hydroxycyclohexanecarboxyl-CoA dehydrogenase
VVTRPDLVLVTGSEGDVGAALVRRLRDAGTRTLAADLASPSEQVTGDRIVLDLADPASVDQATARVLEQHPGCSLGLVHCAGVATVATLAETTDEDLDRMYRVNQLGPLQLTRGLLPALTAVPGSVVFVASDAARSGASHEVGYSASKAALLGAAKSLARELAGYGTTVNVVCPGPIEGRMVREVAAQEPEYLTRLARRIPMRRLARPDDVAGSIEWLLSGDAGYVTGQTLSVSGGITMH